MIDPKSKCAHFYDILIFLWNVCLHICDIKDNDIINCHMLKITQKQNCETFECSAISHSHIIEVKIAWIWNLGSVSFLFIYFTFFFRSSKPPVSIIRYKIGVYSCCCTPFKLSFISLLDKGQSMIFIEQSCLSSFLFRAFHSVIFCMVIVLYQPLFYFNVSRLKLVIQIGHSVLTFFYPSKTQ